MDQSPYKWPGARSAAGDSGGRLEDEGEILGKALDLEYLFRHREGNTNRRSLERVAHAGKVDLKFRCNVFKATTQGALLSGLCAFAGQKWKLHRE